MDRFAVNQTQSLCDLQIVQKKTGAEFHNMAQREMHSLGAPTWEERCCQAGEHRGDSTSICSGWTRGQTTCWGQSSCATGAMPSTM